MTNFASRPVFGCGNGATAAVWAVRAGQGVWDRARSCAVGQGRVAPAASQKAGGSQAGEGSTGTLMGCAQKGVPTAAKTQGLSSDLLLQEGQRGIFLLLLYFPGRAKQVEESAKLPLLVPRGVLLLFPHHSHGNCQRLAGVRQRRPRGFFSSWWSQRLLGFLLGTFGLQWIFAVLA